MFPSQHICLRVNERQVSNPNFSKINVDYVGGCRHGVYFFRTGDSRLEPVSHKSQQNNRFSREPPFGRGKAEAAR